MLPILKNLIIDGFNLRWHIIGGDINTAPIEFQNLMKEYNLEEYIIFHGNQNNPYRFMRNADLLLIPSYHEAAPMVYEEARCLNLPILTTRTLSADELVSSNEIGMVCENSDDAIESALRNVLTQPDMLEVYRHHDKDCNNTKALNEFFNLINKEM